MSQACRTFANSHPRLPELLAKYTHYLMSHDKKRGASRALLLPGSPRLMPLPDDMLEQRIENISVVFCLIDDKDIFKKYYSKLLAKRLIKGDCTCVLHISSFIKIWYSVIKPMILCTQFLCRHFGFKRYGNLAGSEAAQYLRR